MRTAVAILVLAGCRARVPLGDVPMDGGTAADRELLRAELAAFEDWIGEDRVALKRVELKHPIGHDDRIGGRYHSNGWIEIDPTSPMSITSIVRHELCHALVGAEDLLADGDPLFEELGAGLFRATGYGRNLDLYPTVGDREEEAFAEFCALGPMALSALTTPCRGEPEIAAEVGARLLDEVYSAWEPPPPVPAFGVAAPVTLDAWAPSFPSVASSTVAGALAIGWEGVDGVAADVRTGAVLDVVVEPLPDGDIPIARGIWAVAAAAVEDGPAAVVGYVPLEHLGRSEQRTWVFDPALDDWRPVEGACHPPEGADMFAAEGTVWRSWTEAEGVLLRWAPLLPAPGP